MRHPHEQSPLHLVYLKLSTSMPPSAFDGHENPVETLQFRPAYPRSGITPRCKSLHEFFESVIRDRHSIEQLQLWLWRQEASQMCKCMILDTRLTEVMIWVVLPHPKKEFVALDSLGRQSKGI